MGHIGLGRTGLGRMVATVVATLALGTSGAAAVPLESGGVTPPGPVRTAEPEAVTPAPAGPVDATDAADDAARTDGAGASRSGAALQAVPQSTVGVIKESNVDGAAVTPGSEFLYTITVRCSGLTAGCVNQRVEDLLPPGLEVTSLPDPTATRSVTHDASTGLLSVAFTEPLQEPVGEVGLNDGATRSFDIGVRLPAATSMLDGDSITNTATTSADNADPASATDVLTVSVPKVVRPVATKSWTDGAAIAGSGEASTVTLGIRNASSSSVTVQELRIDDVSPGTWERFDLTGAELVTFPAGTDQARLWVCTRAESDCADAAAWTAGAPVSAAGVLPLPGGVSADQVTGVRVVLADAGGAPLPYDATGGTVRLGLELRDTLRSTGSPQSPTSKVTVANEAVPGAVEDTGDLTSGPGVTARYDIHPDTVLVSATKTFVADTDGDFARQNGEYAVIGEGSPVSATISLRNDSAFPLRHLRITEPDSAAPATEFDKLDVSKVRLRLPGGATGAEVTVSYADGSADLVRTLTATGVVDVARAGTRVSAIEVVFTGDADGAPSIAVGSTAHLDLHGRLTSQVTADDLPDGVSPGVHNCAAYRAQADTSGSTGTTAGNACATLPVETVRRGGAGTKSVGQGSVPPGQPIPFTITLRNNGNVALVDPVISDPPTEADGTPRAAANPFAVLRLVSATVRKDAGTPPVALEVFDPSAAGAGDWVAYPGAAAEVLERATGLRAVADGELAPTKQVFVDLVTQRRDGVPDGVRLANCFAAGAVGWDGDPACAAEVTTAPASSAAALNKTVSPSVVPAPIPGVRPRTVTTRITVANTGNVSANRLQVTDATPAFFDAVDLVRISQVTFPLGADRVRIDALTASGWVTGASVGSAGSYALPGGVAAADVIGLRATFTAASGGYSLRPCEGVPTPAGCTGAVAFETQVRRTLRSDAATMPDGTLQNTATAGYETRLQSAGTLAPVAPVQDGVEVVEGDPQLEVQKTPNSAIAPGENAPFRLTVTNTGTADLPDLVVRDLLPSGLTFDETYAAPAGFRLVDVEVPAGTDLPPTPTFTPEVDGDRVGALRWSFGTWVLRPGATLTLEIQVRLSPGVTDGQVHTNLVGATAGDPDLTCAPGTGTQSGGPLGTGTWCTDTAAVTTKAGAAFEARKWVAGTDALGWWNNRAGEPVTVGDASCPSLTSAGRTYTAYPCVALVGPGDRFDYLLRFVNAGTEPATSMRVIDRFPVLGDKGVVLSGTDRGTQWDARPTLATAPTLVGAGTLSTTYAHSEGAVCTADLAMTNTCGASTWSDPFGPEAVAMQMRVAWGTPLPPGEAVDIAFAMDSPVEVTQVGAPTIAWNSFGHAEITRRANGTDRVLPPTEPIQVGVAMAYGTLRVTKRLLANPAGLPVAGRDVEIDYECALEPAGGTARTVASGTLTLRPGQTRDVTGIPAGAECRVWEEDALGGVTNHPADDPAVVTITAQLGSAPSPAVEVEVTNSYPLTEITLAKTVAGAAASYGAATTYRIEVTCTMDGVTAAGFPVTVSLVGSASQTLDAPMGTTCTARELGDGGATSSTVSPAAGVAVTADPAAPRTLRVTNTFEAGRLEILKRITGVGAGLPAGPFEYRVDCTFEGAAIPPVPVRLTRTGGAAELVGAVPLTLPIGAECTVTETDDGGADATPAPVTVTIVENADANTVRATFTNEFSAARVSLTKALAGAGAGQPWASEAVFTVEVTCALGAPAQVLHSEAVRIRGGERVDLTTADGDPVLLPRDARCWAVESETRGATSVRIDAGSWDDALVVGHGTPTSVQQLDLEVTNTFDLTSVAITKVVDGTAAAYATGREFRAEVSCVLPQGTARTPLVTRREVTLAADRSVVIEDLPVRAECWAVETDDGGATRSRVDAGPTSPLVLGARRGTVTVRNTFDAGSLVVGKRVVDGPAGPYSLRVACTTEAGRVRLRAADARFRLRHGERRRISVPLGAACTVTEPGAPADAEVTFEDSHRRPDGRVVVGPRSSVTVINTFDPGVAGNQGDGDPGEDVAGNDDAATGALPNAGGPAAWLIGLALGLVGLGVALLLAARRRRA